MLHADILRPFALVFLALTFIVIGDAAGKTMAQSGISPLFIAWTRFALAAALILPFGGLRTSEWKALFDWRVLLRAGLIVAGICSILTALRTEPIANVFGGFFIGPVVSYLLSVLLLGERVTASRSFLLVLGFVGVLLVVKPGIATSAGMLFAVLAGCFHGAYLVATRWLASDFRPSFLLTSQLVLGALVLLPFGLPEWPEALDSDVAILVAISALGSAAGNYLLVIVNRRTPASLVAPLIYTQLIAATAIGYFVFSEWPDLISLAGLCLILASGLLSLWATRLSTPAKETDASHRAR
ncbi:DMT family transporter [Thalassococcus sp. S3]|uniref:DMT family transporter n=1 Tax=Thalassococcus sp. S3 TaxID=2017482 RepID=UPI0010240B15|nr:DMT family transporter [Thalassococcus sp. S3]QBF32842.1 hypothetical protein CFI11_16680 [Thalassococcus sp. S3]